MKKIYKFALTLVATASLIFSTSPIKTFADSTSMEDARYIIENNYVNPVGNDVLNSTDIQGMVKALNDPYSQYFTASEGNDFVNSIDMKFSGIGVRIDIVPEGVKVLSLMDNSPAKDSGIKVNDIIIEADGHTLAGLATEVATGYIKGPESTKVAIKVKRGDEILSFDIERKVITSATVYGEILDNHIGYINIASFGDVTGGEFNKTLNELEKSNPNKYIIDLRNNGGGYLTTALDIQGYFIEKNVGLIMEDRNGKTKYLAQDHGKAIDKPIIFLTNSYTASASEILSAAVKDYGKAFFVGTNTYGKGVAQSLYPLSDGSVLKITTNRFYSPLGNVINKVGISPDLEVKPDNIDPLSVAVLLSSAFGDSPDMTGYVRCNFGNKIFKINTKEARKSEEWEAYNYILDCAVSNNSNIEIGNKTGYITSDQSTSAEDREKLFYPDYKEIEALKDVPTDKKFTITYSEGINLNTLDQSTVELIEADNGARVPLDLAQTDDKKLTAAPKSPLQKGQTYYLAVNDNTKSKDNKQIKQGAITMIQVAK